MIDGTHFKYVTAETASAIIAEGALRWSAPRVFNDAFDMDIEPRWEISEAEFSDDQIKQLARSQDPSLPEPIPEAMLRIRHELRKTCTRFDDEARRLSEQTKERYLRYLEKARVLCLSRNLSSLSMWAHYANSHRGALLGFVPDSDGTFCGTKINDVNYSDVVPRALSIDDFVALPVKGIPKGIDLQVFRKIVLTKSAEWAYEEECRCIAFVSDSADRIQVPFDRSRLVSVTYGLRTSEEDIARIEGAINSSQMRRVRRYRAQRQVARFSLNYVLLPGHDA